MLDSIGCAIAGTAEETGQILKQFLEDNGGNKQATVIGSSFATSMTTAAFANGVLMPAMEFDNNSMPAMAHTTTCVLMGQDMDQMIRALGIAASSFTGLKQNMGSMTRPNAFEGPQGYGHIFSSEPRSQHIDLLGKE